VPRFPVRTEAHVPTRAATLSAVPALAPTPGSRAPIVSHLDLDLGQGHCICIRLFAIHTVDN
jgi:hypothetical protein